MGGAGLMGRGLMSALGISDAVTNEPVDSRLLDGLPFFRRVLSLGASEFEVGERVRPSSSSLTISPSACCARGTTIAGPDVVCSSPSSAAPPSTLCVTSRGCGKLDLKAAPEAEELASRPVVRRRPKDNVSPAEKVAARDE